MRLREAEYMRQRQRGGPLQPPASPFRPDYPSPSQPHLFQQQQQLGYRHPGAAAGHQVERHPDSRFTSHHQPRYPAPYPPQPPPPHTSAAYPPQPRHQDPSALGFELEMMGRAQEADAEGQGMHMMFHDDPNSAAGWDQYDLGLNLGIGGASR